MLCKSILPLIFLFTAMTTSACLAQTQSIGTSQGVAFSWKPQKHNPAASVFAQNCNSYTVKVEAIVRITDSKGGNWGTRRATWYLRPGKRGNGLYWYRPRGFKGKPRRIHLTKIRVTRAGGGLVS